jgi:hypothetical protein
MVSSFYYFCLSLLCRGCECACEINVKSEGFMFIYDDDKDFGFELIGGAEN